MAEDAAPRKRGRPPKLPGESTARPNMSLRLRKDIYEQILIEAEKNDRSISGEVEARVEQSFSQLPDQVAKAAVQAALEREEQEYIKFFGGRLTFHVAAEFSQIFREALVKLTQERDIGGDWIASDDNLKALEVLLSDLPTKIVSKLRNDYLTAKALELLTNRIDGEPDFLQKMWDSSPELREKMGRSLTRRQKKTEG